ncbi:hypothetical protein GC176_06335 [bacterium]|nr:hypothetical protein [bacterium]
MILDRILRGLPLALLFAFLLITPASSFAQPETRRNPERLWTGDYRGALATAQRESKPIMLVFRCVP